MSNRISADNTVTRNWEIAQASGNHVSSAEVDAIFRAAQKSCDGISGGELDDARVLRAGAVLSSNRNHYALLDAANSLVDKMETAKQRGDDARFFCFEPFW